MLSKQKSTPKQSDRDQCNDSVSRGRQSSDGVTVVDSQNSDAFQRAIVACAPMPIISIDLEGRVQTWNEAAELVFGWSEKEVLGCSLPLVPAEGLNEHMETRRRMLAGERISRLEVLRQKKNGDPVELSLSTSAMSDSSGEVIGFMAVFEDITEQRQQQQELRRAKEHAESANRAKSEFLSNLSHEIRTPLNGLLGMMQILESSALDQEQAAAVETAFGSIDRLSRLLGDLLNLSKIEAEQLEKDDVEFSLSELCATVCDEYARAAQENGLTFECCAPGPVLPEWVIGDELRLRHVLYNLVGNAIKFTEHGGVKLLLIPLREEQEVQWIQFAVEDTGVGVAQEHLSRLFEPFYRAEGAYNRAYPGAGLGLPLVHRLVRLMGGRVHMESTVGVGSVVQVELPFRIAEAPTRGGSRKLPGACCRTAQSAPVSPDAPVLGYAPTVSPDVPDGLDAPKSASGFPPLDILLAEDDKINQVALRHLLRKRGHRVEVANNGQEAVDLFAQHEFDCILMDIQMPVMNGIEATESIRTSENLSTRKRVPIFAVTAHALAGDRERFMAAGMDSYLSKPLRIEDLEKLFTEHGLFARQLP